MSPSTISPLKRATAHETRPSDRRASRRIPFRGYVNRIQDGVSTICRCEDLSTTGMALHAVTAGPRATSAAPISLEFQLPHSEEVFVVHGKPVRQRGRSVAVEFTRITPRQRAMIDGWIAAARIAVPGI